MENYNRDVLYNAETGEVIEEFITINKPKRGFYQGPREFWRIMNTYDKAQLLVPSLVGIKILHYIKSNISLVDYRIDINQTWLAEDLDTSRRTIINNINKLVDAKYLIKEERGKYFVSPNMFWINGMSDSDWQKLKQDYLFKLK